MKLAIMQPYVFPYLGYFQLIHAVDKFVLYDDVNFIKQGWINRNRLLVNGSDFIFTIPLKNASSFNTIARTEINQAQYSVWLSKFRKTMYQEYARTPNYAVVSDLVLTTLNGKHDTINTLASSSIMEVNKYLGIHTTIVPSASTYNNNDLKAQGRVIDICRRENATCYINSIGGKNLYLKEEFANFGISLNFMKSRIAAYRQHNGHFVPSLSIIDVLMFNKPEDIKNPLNEYDLL